MRVAIISIVNIKHMTLVSLYTDFFEKMGIEYDLIYIDKYHIEEKNRANNIFKYEIEINQSNRKAHKLIKYYGFRGYVKKILEKNKYDYVVVWKSETGYLIFDLLVNQYKKKYVLNIRDYAKDNLFPISFIQKKVVKNALFTTISSLKFLDFLPKNDNTIFVNSINPNFINELDRPRSIKKKTSIGICFVGYVRFIENDKKLLLALKNDSRFVIQYYGAGANKLKRFAEKHQIQNVKFIDSFDATETVSLLGRADIINNLYGNNNIALDTAISIKYYYSLLLKIPILVWKETYMEQITKKTCNSFVFDGNYDNLGDRLFKWYQEIDWDTMTTKLSENVLEIKEENKQFQNKMMEMFIGENRN